MSLYGWNSLTIIQRRLQSDNCLTPFYFNEIFLNSSRNLNPFLFLNKSVFISFFVNQSLDVPVCFKKSHSLRRVVFELPLLKFTNMLMKSGKREQTLVIVMIGFFNFLNDTIKNTHNSGEVNLSWFEHFNLINQFFINKQTNCDYDFKNKGFLFSNYTTNFNNKLERVDLNVKSIFLKKLKNILPVFTFFIYNVDKNIRKYSRGKSGKYVFVWKYVAPYKRPHISLKWILKDVKFNNNFKISKRLSDTFYKLSYEPKTSFAWRSNIFAHNYAFKNLKKTLMTSSRTTV